MNYNFTAQDVLNKVIEIGNRFPDYSYMSPNDGLDTCRYTNGADGQGCIVGQALRALGVPYDVLARYDQGLGASASLVAEEILHEDIGEKIAERLDNIQAAQDSGYPWGECVR